MRAAERRPVQHGGVGPGGQAALRAAAAAPAPQNPSKSGQVQAAARRSGMALNAAAAPQPGSRARGGVRALPLRRRRRSCLRR